MKSILSFLKRNIFIFIACIVACVIGGVVIMSYQPLGSYRTITFATMGVENEGNEYFDSDAATYFAETVRGWLKDPAFLQQVQEKVPGMSFSANAHAQERQNVVIEVTASSQEASQKSTDSIVETLQMQIAQFNEQTQSSYLLIVRDAHTDQLTSRSKMFFLLAALIAAIALGVFVALVKEAYQKKVSFPEQLHHVYGEYALFTTHQNDKKLIEKLNDLAKSQEGSCVLFCGDEYDLDTKKLTSSVYVASSVSDFIKASSSAAVSVDIITLGKTSLERIQMIAQMIDSSTVSSVKYIVLT